MTPVTKVCLKCTIEKDEQQFQKDRAKADGLKSWCKQCCAIAKAEAFKRHPQRRVRQRAISAKWKVNNRRRVATQQSAYRARKKERVGIFTEEQWGRVLLGYNNRCAACGKVDCPTDPLHRDHMVPLMDESSTNYASNIQPLCPACNCSKNGRPLEQWLKEQGKWIPVNE